MSPEAAQLLSGLADDYYAPTFLVEIEGTPLDPAMKGDVREVKVVLDESDLSSGELKINNFNVGAYEQEAEQRRTAASSGSDEPAPAVSDLKYSDVFRLGSVVRVQIGYADRLVTVLRGTIQSFDAEFNSTDAPLLTVRLLEVLSGLKDKSAPEGQDRFENLKDWEIVERVARRQTPPLEFMIAEADKGGPTHELVVQGPRDELRFLKDLARRGAFTLYTDTKPDPADAKKTTTVLHFARPADGRAAKPLRTYVLAWGAMRNTAGDDAIAPSMLEFKAAITTTSLVSKVTVKHYKDKKVIVGTADLDDLGIPGKDATTTKDAKKEAEKKEVIVTDIAVENEEQAKARALALLKDRVDAFFTAKGKTIGLPDLRPGDNLELRGMGARCSGRYYVKKVTHTINISGFFTEFDVRKTVEGEQV